jgi:hypothetical protein
LPAELLELSRNYPHLGVRFPYIVPVFRGVLLDDVARTPLFAYWKRTLVDPSRRWGVRAIAQRLVEFYNQEANRRGHRKAARTAGAKRT